MERTKVQLKEVIYCDDPYDVAKEADGLVICTEWDEFNTLDFKRIKLLMKRPFILDGRNIYDREEMASLGFDYLGIGR